MDVPNDKLHKFREEVLTLIRNRPARMDWLPCAFRVISVNDQLGFLDYIVIVDHRESWVAWDQVHCSESDLIGFGIAFAKELGIAYQQPILPIQMNLEETQGVMNRIIPSGHALPMPVERRSWVSG